MDEREANIDIVFRNGLKDYEVLPPADLWKNISPVVRRKQRPYIILRAAAMIAVVVSLSFLAYQLGSEISTGLENNALVMNPESEISMPIISGNLLLADAGNDFFSNSGQGIIIPADKSESFIAANDETISPQDFEYQLVTSDLEANVKQESKLSFVSSIINAGSTISVPEYQAQYLPETDPETKTQRWSISALASPTYSINYNSGKNEFADQLLTRDQAIISYSGGVALSFNISKRVSVQSGLYYSTFGHELADINTYSGFSDYNQSKGGHTFEVITEHGTVYTKNSDIFLSDALSDNRVLTRYTDDIFDPLKSGLQPLGSSLLQNFSYLELPFIVRYKVIDKVIDLNIIGGLSSNFLVKNAVFTSSDGKRYEVATTEGMNPLTFSSSFGMGLEYNLSKNLSLNMEPTVRYYINSASGIPGMNLHPYSFGLFSGVSYKF